MSQTSKYFYGHKVSELGIKNKRVDYAALSKCGDIVLCNGIVNLFNRTIGGKLVEPELVNGYLTDEDAIADLQSEIEELIEEQIQEVDSKRKQEIEDEISKIQKQIRSLDRGTCPREILQYYIISDDFAERLQDCTNEIVFYIDALRIYVWGVTHCGTSWDYVLTDIELDDDEK
jgi:hypothetical protein